MSQATIVGFAAAMAWYTWGHWGDFQVDSGRELYVPAQILKGKLLFRDLWYMYGPLAPYLKAMLFWIFGVKLNVLYSFGLTMAIGTALLMYEITRHFRLGIVGNLLPSIFFLSEAFYPTIRNFIFPYSYAASLAAFLGTACLYFVFRHITRARMEDLALASVIASLVVLTKQEFGVTCLALLAFEIAAGFWIRRSYPELVRNVAVCSAGMLPAVAGYGWFVWKLSARLIFFENWISTPGTYFMQTFGKITIPAQGLRFVPAELLLAAEYTALGLALWALMARLSVAAIEKLELNTRPAIALTTFAVFFPLWVAAIAFVRLFPWGIVSPDSAWSTFVIPATEPIVPHGLIFILVLFTGHALWKLVKEPHNQMALLEACLGIYAGLVGVRVMMKLRPSRFECTVFFNGAAFMVFALVLLEVIHWSCRSLDAKRSRIAAGSMFAAEAISLVLLLAPKPAMLPVKLTTDVGSFYTRADVAVLYPRIISFMKSHTQNGKDILVLPEPPSLYVYAGMEAPSRMYALVPGYVAPDQEQQYIDQVSANHVRYVMIANRIVTEYHVPGFANGGYNTQIYNWIMANYRYVGQFGALPGATYPPYTMWVYERNDLPTDGPKNEGW